MNRFQYLNGYQRPAIKPIWEKHKNWDIWYFIADGKAMGHIKYKSGIYTAYYRDKVIRYSDDLSMAQHDLENEHSRE